MQSFDTANPNTIQTTDQDSDHIDRLYNAYGPQLGLNRNQFIEYVRAHQASGGLLPSLPNNQGTGDGGVSPATPMAQALRQQAKATQDDEYYQADVNTQIAQQDLQSEARVADDDNRRFQAVSDAQSIAFGPKADADMDNNTFNQILMRGGGGSQPQTPQAFAAIRGNAQKANFLSAAQRRFRFPKAPGGRR